MQTVPSFVSVCSVRTGSPDLCIEPVSVCVAQLCEAAGLCVRPEFRNTTKASPTLNHSVLISKLWTRSASSVFMLNCANFALESKGNDILGGCLTFLSVTLCEHGSI